MALDNNASLKQALDKIEENTNLLQAKKDSLATVISNKGVLTQGTDSLDVMNTNIESISTKSEILEGFVGVAYLKDDESSYNIINRKYEHIETPDIELEIVSSYSYEDRGIPIATFMDKEKYVYNTHSDGYIYKLDSTGTVIWTEHFMQESVGVTGAFKDKEDFIYLVYDNGAVFKIDKDINIIKETKLDISTSVTDACIDINNNLYILCSNNIYKLDSSLATINMYSHDVATSHIRVDKDETIYCSVFVVPKPIPPDPGKPTDPTNLRLSSDYSHIVKIYKDNTKEIFELKNINYITTMELSGDYIFLCDVNGQCWVYTLSGIYKCVNYILGSRTSIRSLTFDKYGYLYSCVDSSNIYIIKSKIQEYNNTTLQLILDSSLPSRVYTLTVDDEGEIYACGKDYAVYLKNNRKVIVYAKIDC